MLRSWARWHCWPLVVGPEWSLIRNRQPSGQAETWLRIEDGWLDRATLSDTGRVECSRYTGQSEESRWREFTASTSDFAEYDGGGDTAEKQFAVQIHIGDNTPPGVMIDYVGRNGTRFRLGVSPATVKLGDDDTTAWFSISGFATSNDAGR